MSSRQGQNGRAGPSPAPNAAAGCGPTVAFCARCGTRTPATATATATAGTRDRVCGECGLGVILECRADAAPRRGDAFIVLDSSLAVGAVSCAAEQLFGTRQDDAVNRHVSWLVVAADEQAQGGSNLGVAVGWAVRGEAPITTVVVRPTNLSGIRITARIASCGPPRAALVVFETP